MLGRRITPPLAHILWTLVQLFGHARAYDSAWRDKKVTYTEAVIVDVFRPGAAKNQPGLLQQRMPLGQLMRIPGREPVPNRLFADLVFRHRRNDLVVHQ